MITSLYSYFSQLGFILSYVIGYDCDPDREQSEAGSRRSIYTHHHFISIAPMSAKVHGTKAGVLYFLNSRTPVPE